MKRQVILEIEKDIAKHFEIPVLYNAEENNYYTVVETDTIKASNSFRQAIHLMGLEGKQVVSGLTLFGKGEQPL